MTLIDEIVNLPDVSFIDNMTLDTVYGELVRDYEEKYEEVTGEPVSLERADPVTLILRACAVQLFHTMLYVDQAGKLDLLKYSYGPYLDNLASLKGIAREPAKPAVVTLRFQLSDVRPNIISIPAGTRVSNGDIVFETDDYAEIPVGETAIEVTATCMVDGEEGNGILIGEINTLMDPIPYVASVQNIEPTVGGTDIEDDDALANRIYMAPSKYSVAGPEEAYRYWITQFNASISDVYLDSPDAGEVLVEFILDGGELPNAAMCSELEEYLADENIRPLTDQVSVEIPETVSYDVNVQYWISKSDTNQAATIQSKVAAAVDDYILWQQSKIGRDINPDTLVSKIKEAGAKRCVVTYPAYTLIPDAKIARIGTKTVTYGGIEND